MERTRRVFSRRQIEGLIADGKSIIILDGNVLSVNSWLKFHPGGDKAIMHMVGRDATDEINALHSAGARQKMKSLVIGRVLGPWENFKPPIQGGEFRPYDPATEDEPPSEVEEEQGIIEPEPILLEDRSPTPSSLSSDDRSILMDPSIRRRHADSSATSVTSVSTSVDETDQEYLTRKGIEADLAKYPSLDSETQRHIVQKYRELEVRIRDAGLYKCNYWAYGRECVRYLALLFSSLLCLYFGWYKTSAALLGGFWHQLTFTAHDAGHMGITGDFQTDTCIGIFVADFCGGLSLGWWKRNHNVHHIVTNDTVHDPDIQHLPFFAISHRFFTSLRSSFYDRVMYYDAAAKFFVRFQNYLYYPVLCFGRFNLYRLSLEYLLLGLGPRRGIAAWHRYLELGGMSFFWLWFGYGIVYKALPTNSDRLAYVLISHIITMPLHVQITLSHFAMSTADLGTKESFPQKMLRTSMDVDCPEWFDFFHGGLQFQVIHHLYPRVPRHNLRTAQKYVIEFCKEVGIPYAIYGFYNGNKEVIGQLREVARQASIMAECQRSMVDKREYGHF